MSNRVKMRSLMVLGLALLILLKGGAPRVFTLHTSAVVPYDYCETEMQDEMDMVTLNQEEVFDYLVNLAIKDAAKAIQDPDFIFGTGVVSGLTNQIRNEIRRNAIRILADSLASHGIVFTPTSGEAIILSNVFSTAFRELLGVNINMQPYSYVMGLSVVYTTSDGNVMRVPGAQVLVLDGNQVVQTIDMDRFTNWNLNAGFGWNAPMLSTIRPGNYSIMVSAPGFVTRSGDTAYWRRIGFFDGVPRSVGGDPPWYGPNNRIFLRPIIEGEQVNNNHSYFLQFYESAERADTNRSLRFFLNLFHHCRDTGGIFGRNVTVPGAEIAIFDGEELVQVIYLDNHISNVQVPTFYTTRLGTYRLEISVPGFQVRNSGDVVHRLQLGTLREVVLTNQGITIGGPGGQIGVSVEFVISEIVSCEIEITLNPTGGTVSLYQIQVRIGEAYGDLPIPTRRNHRFDGWYTAAVGGERVTSETAVTNTTNHTLYARWLLWGDVNGDGRVDSRDLELLQRHLNFGHLIQVQLDPRVADVVLDGRIDSHDLALLQRYLNFRHLIQIELGVSR